MLAALTGLAKQFAIAAGRAAAERIAELLAPVEREESHPLSHRDVEHIRAQERSAIAAAKAAAGQLRACDWCHSAERARHLWRGQVFCDDVAACGRPLT